VPLLRGRRAAATVGPAATPQPIHQTPDMDAAVIELDDAGRPAAMADVQLSPQYPHGVTVPLDLRMLATGQIRYRWWDDDEWDANGGKGTRDVLSCPPLTGAAGPIRRRAFHRPRRSDGSTRPTAP